MGNQCYYCERKFHEKTNSGYPLKKTSDHIIPKDKGGRDFKENKLDACRYCNGIKGNLYLEDFEQLLEYRIKALATLPDNSAGSHRKDRLEIILKNVKDLIIKIRPYRETLFKNYAHKINQNLHDKATD